jgi:hypothetical protein
MIIIEMLSYGFLKHWMQETTMNIRKNILALLWKDLTIAVCGFFELSGVLVNHGLIDQNLYFDIFNPTLFGIKPNQ